MGKTYEKIDDKIRKWMERQHMFFVGTASPLLGPTHVVKPYAESPLPVG